MRQPLSRGTDNSGFFSRKSEIHFPSQQPRDQVLVIRQHNPNVFFLFFLYLQGFGPGFPLSFGCVDNGEERKEVWEFLEEQTSTTCARRFRERASVPFTVLKTHRLSFVRGIHLQPPRQAIKTGTKQSLDKKEEKKKQKDQK